MATELWRTRPYAHHVQHIVDGLYDQAFAPFSSNPADGGSTGFQSLPVNVWETDEAYLATLMAPGLDERTINVTIHEDTLAIEGSLAFEAPEGARAVVWQEFGQAKFRRSLRLGASIDASKVEALYHNGLLMLTMPKAEHSKSRQIQVHVQVTSKEAKAD